MTDDFTLPAKYAERATLSVEETAELLGLPEQTVYGHVRSGAIRARRLGKRWLILVPALREFFAQPKAAA